MIRLDLRSAAPRDGLLATAQTDGTLANARPEILFVCIHNAGRSQMAAAFARDLGGDRVVVWSAGSTPASEVNPAVVAAMREMGIDLTQEAPKPIVSEIGRAADVVITMGCGDACPIYRGKRYEDWELDDPAGRPMEMVREIREEIRERVRRLLAELGALAPQR